MNVVVARYFKVGIFISMPSEHDSIFLNMWQSPNIAHNI